jgi:carbonic anhydrase/acetyltransferase-like protein (isoleucine patch superfamily)
MATRLYLPASTATTRISPTPDAAWEDTSALARIVTHTAVISNAMASVSFADATNTDKDVLLRQYVTKLPLTVGQTITGSQALKWQVRGLERVAGNNLFTTIGIRVVKGTTVNKTVLVVTRDGVELSSALTNRQFTATSAATNYTTVAGDFLVVEIGAGGDPANTGGADHDYTLRLGDAAAADLAEDDTTTTDNNPWVQFTDTLTFIADTVITPPVLALITAAFAPTVSVTNNQRVTPPVLALIITAFAPTVRTPRLVTPPTATLITAAFAPTVTAISTTTKADEGSATMTLHGPR